MPLKFKLLSSIAPALFILPSLISTSALANAAEEDVIDEIIVIVGKNTNVSINSTDLEKLQASSLADIFRNTPSISVGGSVGIAEKIYVRGLEDTLLNVTVDGAQQTGTLFHHIGRVAIEPEILETVYVQSGAGEATSGFGAIGGAIRFKTKTAQDLLGEKSIGGLVKAAYFSNDGFKLNANLYGEFSENWGILGSYVYTKRENKTSGSGEEIYGTSAEQSMAFIKVNGQIAEDQTVTFSYEQRNENAELGRRPNWTVTSTDILYPIDAKRQTGIFNYSGSFSDFFNLEASAFFTRNNFIQNGPWGLYGGTTKTFGFDLRNTAEIQNHEITFGFEYRNDTVSAGSLENGGNGHDLKETGNILGFYIQDHFQPMDDLTLSFGLRYDRYNFNQPDAGGQASSNILSPNIGLEYQFTNDLSFSIGYAKAARGKEIGDAFTLSSQEGTIQPDLKAETAHNKEVALVYNDGTWNASASYFHMKLDNVILDQLGRGTYYENIGTYISKGIELKLGYNTDQGGLDLSFTSYDPSLNGNPVEGYEHNGLGNASGGKIIANLHYTPLDNLELGWRFTHVFNLNDIEVLHRALAIGWVSEIYTIDKPGYSLNDLYAQWSPSSFENFKITLTINNLFDVNYRAHASVGDYQNIPGWGIVRGVYESGRDIRIAASYRF